MRTGLFFYHEFANLRINFRKKIKKLLLKGVGAEHQETLSVPLLRYSAPAVVPFSRVRAKRGIEGVRQDDLLVSNKAHRKHGKHRKGVVKRDNIREFGEFCVTLNVDAQDP